MPSAFIEHTLNILVIDCSFADTQWLQASSPIKDGVLSIRRVSSLALPALLSSAAKISSLQDRIWQTAPGLIVSISRISRWYGNPFLVSHLILYYSSTRVGTIGCWAGSCFSGGKPRHSISTSCFSSSNSSPQCMVIGYLFCQSHHVGLS